MTDQPDANDDAVRSRRLLSRVQLMFSRYYDGDISHDLETVAEYYSHLADNIDYEAFRITANRELLDSFESVFLWLQDKLLAYPEAIRTQILEIVREKQLCEIVGIVANLSERHLSHLRRQGLFRRLPSIYSFFGFTLALPRQEREYLTEPKLFDAKMALKRLSQIIRFAATVNVVDYDEAFRDFRNNYDPNLVDKHKLLALINILRVQINNVPDEDHKKLVLEKLEGLESELKRPNVRWGVVITGFFILLGFLADLKTLSPQIYDEPKRTVESILNVLHSDGVVQQSRPRLLGGPDGKPNDHGDGANDPHESAILTEPPRLRGKDDGDDQSSE